MAHRLDRGASLQIRDAEEVRFENETATGCRYLVLVAPLAAP